MDVYTKIIAAHDIRNGSMVVSAMPSGSGTYGVYEEYANNTPPASALLDTRFDDITYYEN